MSFDIFVQRFEAGDTAPADGALVRSMLAPYTVTAAGGHTLRFRDGEADLHGFEDLTRGFMVNGASGDEVWDLLWEVASRAGLTIMPVGCPSAVPAEQLLGDLPEPLGVSAAVIGSGADLKRLIISG
jgi:hypothetical protein